MCFLARSSVSVRAPAAQLESGVRLTAREGPLGPPLPPSLPAKSCRKLGGIKAAGSERARTFGSRMAGGTWRWYPRGAAGLPALLLVVLALCGPSLQGGESPSPPQVKRQRASPPADWARRFVFTSANITRVLSNLRHSRFQFADSTTTFTNC